MTIFDDVHHLGIPQPLPAGSATYHGGKMLHYAGPNTNGSQFFICFKSVPFLDGGYTVFGKVVEGLEVIDALEAVGSAQDPIPPSEKVFFSIEVKCLFMPFVIIVF